MIRKIFFDAETKNIFSDVGSNNPADLDMSIVCIYDSATEKYQGFLESELGALWPIIEKADLLVGYNSDHFDIPLLSKYYPGDLSKIKSLDLMKEVKNVLGHRIRLDNIAGATLGKKKLGHGLDAIHWWKNGEIEKLRSYCLEDVRITKEIYDYALKNGLLKYKDADKIKDIILDTTDWEEKKEALLTHTLPF